MATSPNAPPPDTDSLPARVLVRPPDVLNRLPLEMKWEFTRRHPYYLANWVAAAQARAPGLTPEDRTRAEAARQLLLVIGLTDIPPPPGTPYEQLSGSDLGGIWQTGAVAPAIFRTLIGVLLVGLPPALCDRVGRLLAEYAERAKSDTRSAQYRALVDLKDLAVECPDLDKYPDAPFVSVNTNAPQRAIVEAITLLTQRFKVERAVTETRRRDDSYPDYLAVWDRREGWTGEGYDCGREQTLSVIAADLKVPVRTVQNRYRMAFFWLTGHEYSPERWAAVVGEYKLSLVAGGAVGTLLARPWRTRGPRPVPEAVLTRPAAGEPGPGVVDPSVPSDNDLTSLLEDISHLIALDRTNSEIRGELDLTTPGMDDALNYLRARAREVG
jgi:hypothetical protein